jgi:ATP-binding cassette subfamily B protein
MAFGRDIAIRCFHPADFSAQERRHLPAPSLITRITNDVAGADARADGARCSSPDRVASSVFMAVREDGHCPLAVGERAGARGRARVITVRTNAIRDDAGAHDQSTRCCEQIAGCAWRAFGEPDEAARFAIANDDLTLTSLRRAAHGVLFPTIMLVLNVERGAIWLGETASPTATCRSVR